MLNLWHLILPRFWLVHPGRLTAGTYKSPILERNMIWTKPPWGHVPAVNLPGCKLLKYQWYFLIWLDDIRGCWMTSLNLLVNILKRMVKNQYPHGIGLTKTAKSMKGLCQCYCTLYTVYCICKAYTNRSVPKLFSSNYAKCQGQWHNPRNQCIEIFTGTFGLALSGGGMGGNNTGKCTILH